MGIMDRDYMYRTPEEREAALVEKKKHQERQNEMYDLFSKGDSLSKKERKRLEEIYEENRLYLEGKTVHNISAENPDFNEKSKKSGSLPVILFTLVLVVFIFIAMYFPNILRI